MISILTQERLLGASLGVVLTGVVVFEQRRYIYSSISQNQSQGCTRGAETCPRECIELPKPPRCYIFMLLAKLLHGNNSKEEMELFTMFMFVVVHNVKFSGE
ncbi:hypothetical protein DEO72_LG3g2739 [Vigna unguiculata]|uniref:Uncharacterized protein n=1 Tax=Vigna unguiculata TaxID=3917 RepID=A0A4D6LI10_VIGUN|nr:hypothetical protein DEO72_LG3g2739 [Vigna unguiculata]